MGTRHLIAVMHNEQYKVAQYGQWDENFNKLLDSLPEDTLLTVVDCHI